MHRRGASRFCRIFLSHRTEMESFVKEHFCLPENCWYRKNLWIRGGISRFSVEIFMSHSAEKFRKGILLFLRKNLVSKSYMDEKGGGVITFSRRKFLVSQHRENSWASLQCFRKFGVSKNFMHNRGYHNFPSKISGFEKLYGWRGGVSRFSVENFLSRSAEKFRSGILSAWLISSIEKC